MLQFLYVVANISDFFSHFTNNCALSEGDFSSVRRASKKERSKLKEKFPDATIRLFCESSTPHVISLSSCGYDTLILKFKLD